MDINIQHFPACISLSVKTTTRAPPINPGKVTHSNNWILTSKPFNLKTRSCLLHVNFQASPYTAPLMDMLITRDSAAFLASLLLKMDSVPAPPYSAL